MFEREPSTTDLWYKIKDSIHERRKLNFLRDLFTLVAKVTLKSVFYNFRFLNGACQRWYDGFCARV